jgi:hypothetical protein
MKNRPFFTALFIASTSVISDGALIDVDSLNIGTGNTVSSGSKSAVIGDSNEAELASLFVRYGNFASYGSATFGESNTAHYDSLAGGYGSFIDENSGRSIAFGDFNTILGGFDASTFGTDNKINVVHGYNTWSGGYEYGSFIAGKANNIRQANGVEGWSNMILGENNTITTDWPGSDSIIRASVLIGKDNATIYTNSWVVGLGNNG